MLVTDPEEYKKKIKRGLKVLGPNYTAFLCWRCDGSTRVKHRSWEYCDRCAQGYGTGTGLMVGDSKPAPASVVNQVLVAAEREDAEPVRRC